MGHQAWLITREHQWVCSEHCWALVGTNGHLALMGIGTGTRRQAPGTIRRWQALGIGGHLQSWALVGLGSDRHQGAAADTTGQQWTTLGTSKHHQTLGTSRHPFQAPGTTMHWATLGSKRHWAPAGSEHHQASCSIGHHQAASTTGQ